MRFAVHLPHEPSSVPRARDALERLRAEVHDRTLADARLLVSELVTNSVRHARSRAEGMIELVVERRPGALRIEVADTGGGFVPRARVDGQDQGSGWGLHLVERLAKRWGVVRDRGARVWLELEDRAA